MHGNGFLLGFLSNHIHVGVDQSTEVRRVLPPQKRRRRNTLFPKRWEFVFLYPVARHWAPQSARPASIGRQSSFG